MFDFIWFQGIAEEAVALLRPIITTMIEKTSGKKGVAIVVAMGESKDFDDDVIVYEGCIKDGDEFRQFALGKAKVSWRTKAPSGYITSNYPMMLKPGDCVWQGSAVESMDEFKVVVATSGLSAYQDEAVSYMLITAINMFIAADIRKISENGGIVQ